MILDSHHHFFSKEQYTEVYEAFGRPDVLRPLLRDFTPEDMKPLLDEVGVDQTIQVQIGVTQRHTREMLASAEGYSWIAGVIAWVDLSDPRVGETLDSLCEHPKFVGIRHPLEHEDDPNWILRDEVVSGLRELEKRRIVFDLLVGPRHWDILPQLVELLPGLTMVIEHFGRPDAKSTPFVDWEHMMAKMAQYPKVNAKLSGIMVLIPDERWDNWHIAELKPYISKTIELFGVDRVMFGSDWPVSTLVGSYKRNFEAIQGCVTDMREQERSKIFGDNAKRVYQIS
ncbi:MAG: amidohydrolase family protein [Anaerolineales bacterium]|jgi:L-fuconolactonase